MSAKTGMQASWGVWSAPGGLGQSMEGVTFAGISAAMSVSAMQFWLLKFACVGLTRRRTIQNHCMLHVYVAVCREAKPCNLYCNYTVTNIL